VAPITNDSSDSRTFGTDTNYNEVLNLNGLVWSD
jgi:hypothetical protein